MAGNVVDYGFYLIQRGEAGHRRGCYLNEYKDSGGIETIGYGTVTRPGYNTLNYRQTTITEEQAVDLAKQEMAVKINEKCRTKFKDFDNLLPCYQAAILDTTYQGNWGAIQNAMNEHDMQAVYEAITNNPNRERAAVRGRAIEMGMLIEQAYQFDPNADPKAVAASLAQILIENYGHLNGTDCALTKDELALLYRSVMAAYGVEVDEAEIEQFAMGYPEVASGMCGIGSTQPASMFAGYIPQGPVYDGSRSSYSPLQPDYGSRGYHSFSSLADRYSGHNYAPIPFKPMPVGENQFEPDSKELEVTTCFPTCNYSAPRAKKQMIVLHTTESSSLSSTVSTFQSPSSKVSAHYTIDRDGTIHQHLPEGYTAWHAGVSNYPPLGIQGSCNAESIGIEIQRAPGQPLTPEQIASTMALVKDIQKRQGISPEHTVAHSDVAPGRKSDPGPDFPWGAFAAEGLALPREYHRGMGDENPSLAHIRSTDCAYYTRPDYPTGIVALSAETSQQKADTREQQVSMSEEEKRKAEQQRIAEEERKRILESSLGQTLAQAEEAGRIADEALRAAEERVTAENPTPAAIEAEGNTAQADEDKSGTTSKSSGKKKKKSGGKKKQEKSTDSQESSASSDTSASAENTEETEDKNKKTTSTLEDSSESKVATTQEEDKNAANKEESAKALAANIRSDSSRA